MIALNVTELKFNILNKSFFLNTLHKVYKTIYNYSKKTLNQKP
jgi:hypothetical protein